MNLKNTAGIPEIDWKRTDQLISLALEEDLNEAGDTTTLAVVPENAKSRAVLRCKQQGMVVSGLAVAERVFKTVEPALVFNAFVSDGDVCNYGDLLAEISGPARGILS